MSARSNIRASALRADVFSGITRWLDSFLLRRTCKSLFTRSTSQRRRCLTSTGRIDVFAATIPTLPFTPGVHVNYAETVLPMRDGLPKLKDFPAEFGGSGESIAE